MAEDKNAELERQLELVQQIIDKKVELGSLDAAERQRVMEMANLLSQGEANLGRLVQQRTKLLDIIRQESGAESNKAKLAEQEIQKLKFILVQRTQLGATLDKRLAAIKSENKLLNIQNKGVKDVTANLGKAVGMQIMYGSEQYC